MDDTNILCDRLRFVSLRFHCISGKRAELFLRENVYPNYLKARSVPFTIQPAVQAKLQKLEKFGIITPVTTSKFTTLVLLVVKKDSGICCAGVTRQLSMLLFTWTSTPFQGLEIYLPLLQETSILKDLS